MSNAHTPGPWACISGGRGGEFTVYLPADGMVICSRNQYENRHAEFLANARLISAAPRMFDYIESSAANGCAEARKILEAIHGRA